MQQGCFAQKYAQLTATTKIKTVESNEGKADGSIFLFGLQIKKYFRSLRLMQSSRE